MKSPFAVATLIAISAVVGLSGLSAQADDTTNATPGTAAATDTKNQENNPAGPADQSAKTPAAPIDSKNGANDNATHPTTVKKAGAASATKSVQHKKQKHKIKKDQAAVKDADATTK
jgi:hypothetical protein